MNRVGDGDEDQLSGEFSRLWLHAGKGRGGQNSGL